MRISPTNAEIARIVDVLNDPKLDTEGKAARAVISAVADLLDYRDWYVIAYDPLTRFGPYSSEAYAEAAGREAGLSPEFRIARIASPGILKLRVTDEPQFLKGITCKNCGHFKDLHLGAENGRGRGACALKNREVDPCTCKKYAEIK